MKTLQRSVVTVAICLLFSEPSYAYLDPGTGSFLLQMFIAGVLAVLVYIKFYWGKVKQFVIDCWKGTVRLVTGRKSKKKEEDETE